MPTSTRPQKERCTDRSHNFTNSFTINTPNSDILNPKMKLATSVILSSVAVSSAFAPNQNGRSSTKLQAGEMDDMSKALPFVKRPKLLDGSLPGDVGFE